MDVFGQSISIQDGRDGHLVFGPLDVWVRKVTGEWQISYVHDPETEDRDFAWEEGSAPEDLSWERWITGGETRSLVLRPLPPDRPVIVRPEMVVRLMPGQSTDFYVGLPLWMEISSGIPAKAEKLCEIPSIRLSNSWFGTPQEGEHCYAMRTLAHLRSDALLARMHRCICPVEVKNSSEDVLAFERICLRCQHLQIYRGEARFWTNKVRLSYRGREEWSRVIYGRSPPDGIEATEPISLPRKPISGGLIRRSFRTLGIQEGIA